MTDFYYRWFVQHYAKIAQPQTEITKTNQPDQVEWTATAELAFQRLKSMLTLTPLIKNPDFTRTFILQTDALGVGIGAVLGQGEDNDHPIAYFIRKLIPRERAVSTVEKECLVIVLSVKHFQAYLLGHLFTIQTNH